MLIYSFDKKLKKKKNRKEIVWMEVEKWNDITIVLYLRI